MSRTHRFPGSARALACLVLCSLPLSPINGEESSAVENQDFFTREIRPRLQTYCGKCHGADSQEAEVRFDQLSIDFREDRAAAQTWREALQQLDAGTMPPAEAPSLSEGDRAVLTNWLRVQIADAQAWQRSSGGRVVMRRLNRSQYQHTMSDLLGLEMDYTRDLPSDAISPEGFRNQGQSLQMSAVELEIFLDTARRALERALVSGPPPPVFRHRFSKSNVGGWRGPTETSNRLERAQKFLARIVDDYPEFGEFRIRVRTQARLRPNYGYPRLEVSVGYRPDTEVHFRVAGVAEVVQEGPQVLEFRGRMENFPLPVRGQGKYPGLVIRLRNIYSDGTPIPTKLETQQRDGKEVKAFPPEPHLPHLLIEEVEFVGPIVTPWPPRTHQQILFPSAERHANERAYLEQVLERFLSRAYRRPATHTEVESLLAFFASIRPHFTRFEEALQETLALALIQPDFLYLMEPGGETKRPLDAFELASRLSYFLTDSMPDDRLMQLAQGGQLREPAVLRAEVERLLQDARVERFVAAFVHAWLKLEGVETVAIDRKRFPQFDPQLKPLLQRESVELFLHHLRSGEAATAMLASRFAVLNEPLARFYGIPHVYGHSFRRVALPETLLAQRGGLLGQAGILLANSNGRDSHPVRRGVWIRDALLGDPPPPPPPDVPDLDEVGAEFAKLSVREQLELHRAKPSCGSCHRDIDPWGIALEQYDALGRWRTHTEQGKEERQPVVATAQLPDGTVFDGAASLRTHLATQRSAAFAEGLTRQLLCYALGRGLELGDEQAVHAIKEQFSAHGYRLADLIQQIVASEPFLTK